MLNQVRVLAFAGARDVLGAPEVLVPLDGSCSADELLGRICALFPRLEPYRRSIRVAVNGTYVRGEDPVNVGDEVALIPPVAGG